MFCSPFSSESVSEVQQKTFSIPYDCPDNGISDTIYQAVFIQKYMPGKKRKDRRGEKSTQFIHIMLT